MSNDGENIDNNKNEGKSSIIEVKEEKQVIVTPIKEEPKPEPKAEHIVENKEDKTLKEEPKIEVKEIIIPTKEENKISTIKEIEKPNNNKNITFNSIHNKQ